MNTLLDEYTTTLERISAFPVMRDLNGISTPLYKALSTDMNKTSFSFSVIAGFENTASEILNLNQNVDSVCVVNTAGYGFLVDRKNLWTNSSVFSMDMTQPWVQQTLAERGRASRPFVLDSQAFRVKNGAPYLYVARAIVNAEAYRTVGLSLVGIDLSQMHCIFKTEKVYDSQTMLLIDDCGVIQSGEHTGNNLCSVCRQTSSGRLEYGRGADASVITLEGERMQELSVAIITPKSEFTRMSEAYYIVLYWAIAVLAVITLVIYSRIARSVQQPINQLAQAVQAYAEGDFSPRTQVDGVVEVRLLGDALNTMSEKIENLIDEVYAQQLEKTQYELRVLRSQINPHFLYNALEAVRMRAYLSHDEGVEQIVSDLAAVLRYGLNRERKPATLREELDNVQLYMKVVNACSTVPAYLQVHIQSELIDCLIPHMTLQPLVENCIKHGFAKGAKAGTVVLYGYEEDGDCVINVSDDGCGMDEVQLRTLQDELLRAPHERSDGTVSQHIGLYNVNRRIALLMGEGYGLSVNAVAGRGMSVFIRLPLAIEEEEEEYV